MMINSLKKWLGVTPTEQRMAGATFTINGPLPTIGHCYTLERAVKDLKLTGWMHLANHVNIVMEVHGTFEAVSALLKHLDNGTILTWRPMYEMMWLPYQNKYSNFTYRVFDPSRVPIAR